MPGFKRQYLLLFLDASILCPEEICKHVYGLSQNCCKTKGWKGLINSRSIEENWCPVLYSRRFVLNKSCSKTGRPALFSEYQQKTIFKALSFTYLTVKQLRKHVFLFSKNMRVQIPASWKMQKLAGYEWCLSFIKKFPNVGLSKEDLTGMGFPHPAIIEIKDLIKQRGDTPRTPVVNAETPSPLHVETTSTASNENLSMLTASELKRLTEALDLKSAAGLREFNRVLVAEMVKVAVVLFFFLKSSI